MTLTELCKELRNWFVRGSDDVFRGRFNISDGSIENLDFLQDGQYFRIKGSVFNDGVYQHPASNLTDEVFDGEIWAMRIPSEIVELFNEINTWIEDNSDSINSPYQSESFGGYSYSKVSGGGTSQGITWQGQFSSRLTPWRKL